VTKDLYSILLTNSLKLFSQDSLIKKKNAALDTSLFFGISIISVTYSCDFISTNTKLTNPILTTKLTDEEKVRKEVIDITLNNKFPDLDKVFIKLFDDSNVVTLVESEILSKDDFIKLWNILFKDIIDEYKLGAYYD
jgi:hypothetical protein